MKTKTVATCTLGAIAVTCCLGIGWWQWSGKFQSQAKDAVRQRLADPDSAKFRNVRNVNGDVVCGEFNAKNGMGGYVGYRRFVFTGGDWATFEPSAEELNSEMLENAVASSTGDKPSRTYFVAKEVFSLLGAACM
jgi:hypothetical protein